MQLNPDQSKRFILFSFFGAIVFLVVVRIYFMWNHFDDYGDFFLIYHAAHNFVTGQWDLIYNIDYWALYRNDGVFFSNLPFALLFFSPFGLFTFDTAATIWMILNTVISIINVILFKKILTKLFPDDALKIGIGLLINSINIIVWYDAMYYQRNQIALVFLLWAIWRELNRKPEDCHKIDWIVNICLALFTSFYLNMIIMYGAYILISSINQERVAQTSNSIRDRIKAIDMKKVIAHVATFLLGNIFIVVWWQGIFQTFTGLKVEYGIDFLSYSVFGVIAIIFGEFGSILSIIAILGIAASLGLVILHKSTYSLLELSMINAIIFLIWNVFVEQHHFIIFVPLLIIFAWQHSPTFGSNWVKTIYTIVGPLLVATPIPHSILNTVGLSSISFLKRVVGYIFFIPLLFWERILTIKKK